MRAFVTGATGLLGGNLVQALVDDGHTVTAVVRSRAKAVCASESASPVTR